MSRREHRGAPPGRIRFWWLGPLLTLLAGGCTLVAVTAVLQNHDRLAAAAGVPGAALTLALIVLGLVRAAADGGRRRERR